jgi:hypothetical protein
MQLLRDNLVSITGTAYFADLLTVVSRLFGLLPRLSRRRKLLLLLPRRRSLLRLLPRSLRLTSKLSPTFRLVISKGVGCGPGWILVSRSVCL